jgi:hypothetical protein
MKYLYKQTGMIVESSIALDSMLFIPVAEIREEKGPEEKTAEVKPKNSAAVRKSPVKRRKTP